MNANIDPPGHSTAKRVTTTLYRNRKVRIAGLAAVASIGIAMTRSSDTPRTVDYAATIGESITTAAGIPDALADVLSRSCFDCHSGTPASRWYTRVPPFSMIMARAANEGRKAVDFSRWTGYSTEQQRAVLSASCSDATRGTMPVKAYLRVRSEARLSADDIRTICSTTETATEPATVRTAPRGDR